MKRIMKKRGKVYQAYRLGEEHPEMQRLMKEGKVVLLDDGTYEIFSQEAVNGRGQQAFPGDYIKIDASGYPYPNRKETFHENHIHLQGNEYEQIPKPYMAWCLEDGYCEEIDFLIQKKELVIDLQNPEKTYEAPLWGCLESAKSDAHIIFYEIVRNDVGEIIDIQFNFIAKKEFETDYNIL